MEWGFRPATEAVAQRVEEAWGSLTWLSSAPACGSDLTLGRVVIKRGMSNPRHSHPNSTEVLYLLRGTLRHVIGTDIVRMQPGDTVSIPAGVPHIAYSIGSEDAEMIVAYPTGERQFQPEP